MKRAQFYKTLIIVFFGISFSCTESYEIKTKDFESLLVVEATITDELKPQEVKLSKTFRLESDEPNEVSNAQVWIETSTGTTYKFNQSEPGLYTSTNPFRAELNENYTLKVILSDGTSYSSTAEVLPPPTGIESVDAALTSINGEEGIQIFVNSDRNTNNATYFKYEYEETYKIVVPYYSRFDLSVINEEYINNELFYELEVVLKSEDVKTCYSTKKNRDIILSSLKESQNNYVEKFPIRFIRSDNGIIRDRYSILVTQYVQSFEAYNFYRVIKKLGTIENLFTENQPGFIQGNLASTTDDEEKVIGFFQVSSVSSKRIYFNYTDFDMSKPPYIYECDMLYELDYTKKFSSSGQRNEYELIYALIVSGTHKYYSGGGDIYDLVSSKCADCTTFGSLKIPEFWED